MKAHLEVGSVEVYTQTFGGECDIDDFLVDDYGIQLGDLTISDIPAVVAKKLAVRLVNHLMRNGHAFEFYNDTRCQDQPRKFRAN